MRALAHFVVKDRITFYFVAYFVALRKLPNPSKRLLDIVRVVWGIPNLLFGPTPRLVRSYVASSVSPPIAFPCSILVGPLAPLFRWCGMPVIKSSDGQGVEFLLADKNS